MYVVDGPRRPANAKSSMLQENNAACTLYVHTSFDMYSDRHVLGLLLCSRVNALCCAVLCCARGTALRKDTHIRKEEKTGEKRKKNAKKAHKAKKFRNVPQYW